MEIARFIPYRGKFRRLFVFYLINVMSRPTLATIHRLALNHNLEVARLRNPQQKIWATVKANAYGHGLLRAMHAFEKADGLALIEPEYAVLLREQGWQKPILLLQGFFDRKDLQFALEHQLSVVIHNEEQLLLLEKDYAQNDVKKRLSVFVKINTGMNRLGFKPEKTAEVCTRLRALAAIGLIDSMTLMTHFANADQTDVMQKVSVAEQLHRLLSCSQDLNLPYSVANSSAHLLHDMKLLTTWVRPGIMLYGATPSEHYKASDLNLQAAMTLSSELISIQNLAVGDSVGYASLFTVDKPIKIGVVACGYADGYPRHAPTGTPILVDGVRTRTLGRVSMDMLAVDLTPCQEAHVGSSVTLWGRGLPIDEVAHSAGTIAYELMCALAPRVKVVEGD